MADHKLPRKEVAPRPGQTELRIGRLTKAHGLKGALKIELYTDEPEKRFVPGAVFTLQVPTASKWHGKTLELRELRWYNGHAVGFFEGVDDRSEAETLTKAILWVSQDVKELPAEEDAWYDHQLVGLDALRDGVSVGRVARVDHLPAQDLLAIATAHGEVLVPFVKAIVPEVDLAAGTVTLTPPPGLFEELPDDGEPDDEKPDDEKPDDEEPDGEKPDDGEPAEKPDDGEPAEKPDDEN
ncbi:MULTISPECIES: ribosome maturation factor RimM [unclassified Leifsonia]|uniref:ribosome maturation factor RimM n=1 Tax=unclassified Leifsonia TaxID=2663824 RepID=UPI0008A7C81F|nr:MULTISPECIES: ribosome maturation factor RimM [unclassified Leifsonia]SEI17514.1 16S rRNA processing protein RimM [Leifsonia sp. CL154]SFL91312.1 16S rRNA processing protein RimM [Leifsonia sp. CL147]